MHDLREQIQPWDTRGQLAYAQHSSAIEREPTSTGGGGCHGNAVSLEKQPQSAVTSNYLKQRLRAKIETDKMIAHIRLAIRGTMDYENTHVCYA